jgi:hypothetical protein
LLVVYMSADVLLAWAVKAYSEREQGQLIRTHKFDRPRAGLYG